MIIIGTDYIEVTRGDSLNIEVKNTLEDKVTGINLTGATILLDIGGIIDESDSGVDISTPDSTGVLNIIVSDTLMETLTDSEYILKVTLVHIDGVKETIYRAVLIIKD